MARRNAENRMIARIIKAYLIFNPNSTSNEITKFIVNNDFGLKSQLTTMEIAGLIKQFRNDPASNWFNIEKIETPGRGHKYVVN